MKANIFQFATGGQAAARLGKLFWSIRHQPKYALTMMIAFYLGMSLGESAQAANLLAETTKLNPDVSFEDVSPSSTNGLGYWIWDRVTLDKQTIHLWKSFKIPEGQAATQARLKITVDNAFKVWLDGHEFGSGSDWNVLRIYDFTGRLKSGPHVLAVEGVNYALAAGVIADLQLKLDNGQLLQFPSDASWRIVPLAEAGWTKTTRAADRWPKATIVGPLKKPAMPMLIGHATMLFPGIIPFWQMGWFQFLLSAAVVVFVVISLYLLIQLASQSKAHRLLQAERDRIARDIHDDLGSKITRLLLMGEVAQISSSDNEQIFLMCENARSILASIDEVIWIVNSQHDTLDDFAIYVCKYTQQFLSGSGIRCRLDVPNELPGKPLSQIVRRNFFLVIKEALNNAVRHSQATELKMNLELNGTVLRAIIEDNGNGFDPAHTSAGRNGLTNMVSRMKEIGGSCQITSQPGEACRVTLEVSLKRVLLKRRGFNFLFQRRSAAKVPYDVKNMPSHLESIWP